MKQPLRTRYKLWREKRRDDGQLRWAIYMNKKTFLEMLMKDPKNNCLKTIEHIKIIPDNERFGGMVYMEGLQYPIIDGKVIKEEPTPP